MPAPLVGRPDAAGGIASAKLGTAAPVDASTPLAETIQRLGLISDDGLSETTDRSTEQVRAWGGSLAKVIQTEFGLTYEFTFLTTSLAVLRQIHGEDNVVVSGEGTEASIAIKVNKDTLPERLYVFEVKDGDNKIRIVVPRGQVTEVGDVTYVHSDVIRYQVTVTAYPDDAGNEAYKYLAGPVATEAVAAA